MSQANPYDALYEDDNPEFLEAELRRMPDDEFLMFETTIIRIGQAVAAVHQERLLLATKGDELVH